MLGLEWTLEEGVGVSISVRVRVRVRGSGSGKGRVMGRVRGRVTGVRRPKLWARRSTAVIHPRAGCAPSAWSVWSTAHLVRVRVRV